MEPSAALAEAQGYRVLRVPALSVEPVHDPRWESFTAALAQGRWDWVVFTSALAVDAALRRLGGAHGAPAALLARSEVVAIGEATRAALQAAGVAVSLVPAATTSEGIFAALSIRAVAGSRVALLRSAQGTPVLPNALASLGVEVLDVPLYRLGAPPDRAALEEFFSEASAGVIDVFAFTSSLTVLNILAAARAREVEGSLRGALAKATVAAIGAPTARTLASEGIRVDVVPPTAQFPELLRAIGAAASRPP